MVSPIDVLIGLGWLTPQAADTSRQGRVDDLERLAQVGRSAAARALDPEAVTLVLATRQNEHRENNTAVGVLTTHRLWADGPA